MANQKGGVGKTTTVINLAACLGEMDLNVLVVDLDPQANATSGFGLPRQQNTSLYRAMLGNGDIISTIQATPVRGVDIIASELDLAGSEVDIARLDNYLHCFKAVLEPVIDASAYHFIIVDCPPSLGILTMNALTASHSIVVPMQCEYYALEGLSVITNFIQRLRDSGANPDLELEGILMTMYDGRTNLAGEVMKEVTSHFADKVYKTIIPRNVRLSEAPSHGQPVIHYDRASSGSKAYIEFSKEFVARTHTFISQHPERTPPPQQPEPPQEPTPEIQPTPEQPPHD